MHSLEFSIGGEKHTPVCYVPLGTRIFAYLVGIIISLGAGEKNNNIGISSIPIGEENIADFFPLNL